VRSAAARAQRDLDAYRKQLEKQDAAQIDALQQTLAGRADRTYRAKVDELTTKEAALSLKLATDDAPERLSLRTKLTSLALDDAAREAAKNQLDALDRKEADAIAAQRNVDQQTLTALQTQLRDSVRSDVQRQVAGIHARSLARFQARASELRSQFAAPSGPLIGATTKDGKTVEQVNPNLPAPLRSKIQALHDDYTKAFQKDASATIADFNKTRDLLKKRYDALHGLNDDATRSVQSEIASLQRKREDLYDQMVAQIGREVKTIAQQRGISVVLTNVSATAGGIDLTEDAMKDIETLHE
jgi:Skp family chaperone for outer membrane proteins